MYLPGSKATQSKSVTWLYVFQFTADPSFVERNTCLLLRSINVSTRNVPARAFTPERPIESLFSW